MFLSEIFALSAAACIALSGMLINELNGRVDVIRLARWQMIAAFAMTATASLVVGGWRTIGLEQLGFLALSSLFGIIIASTTYFSAIYAAGPRTTALLFSLTSPFALLLGYLALGETISARQGLGVALVISGILLAVGLPGKGPHRKTEAIAHHGIPWKGVALGVITALGQALGSLFARPAMASGAEPFSAMAVRAGVAAIFFIALMAVPLPALRVASRFSGRSLALAIGSAFFGTGLGMSLLMAALAEGNVGIVSTLSSMTPVVILPMVWARTGKAPPLLAWIGAALAVAGTAFISI
ncbi:DMT family transporter [Rhizobium sp. KVB221]|uniref:DMT family transporter n=1 Tax=Rhizobium setariae TaxID=2801340 RepID=A0A936YM60_9HYPH|nr:DMT family transporter [Rhizobium setariae]MBL0370736.1 DMT family transporter [Rhizobium setariae]